MKILLIANAESQWTVRLCREVFDYDKNEIVILSASNNINSNFFLEKKIDVIAARNSKRIISRLKGIRTIYFLIFMRRFLRKKDFDAIIFIYPVFWEVLALKGLKCLDKIIYMYIGSDLDAQPNFFLKLPCKIICKSRNVIVMTEEQKSIFLKSYGAGFKGKITEMHFGKDCFESIDSQEDSTEECKAIYLNEYQRQRYIVTLGYNSVKHQQIDKVLDKLILLSKEEKDKIFLILPMQYGGRDRRYEKKISDLLIKLNVPFIILTDYYGRNQVAQLVKATDIFINAQTDDAISSAVLEHLYAGSIMLSGEWLERQYKLLRDLEIWYSTFRNFDDLTNVLSRTIADLDLLKRVAANNHGKMIGKWSWEECFMQMKNIYDDYV